MATFDYDVVILGSGFRGSVAHGLSHGAAATRAGRRRSWSSWPRAVTIAAGRLGFLRWPELSRSSCGAADAPPTTSHSEEPCRLP